MHRIKGSYVDTSSGVNLFKTTPPYTVITPELLNAIQEEIMYVITQAGLPVLSQDNDTRTQLWEALSKTVQPYNYVVSSQAAFNALFTRTAANTYKINSAYRSVYFKYVTGGYSVTPILSGGDTWGDLYTNSCTSVEFENGTYINFGDNRGNITVDTSGCYLRNVDLRGIGSVAAGVVNSFYLQNSYVTFDNCKTSSRYSNVDFVGFQGSGTALDNTTGKYINCSVYNIYGTDKVYAFKSCNNLNNCLVYFLDTTVDSSIGFETCAQVSGCQANTITSTDSLAIGFNNIEQVSGCQANTITSGNSSAIGFQNIAQVSGCQANTITSTNSVAIGFSGCTSISGCKANTISGGVGGGDLGYGFDNCDYISSCYASTITGTTHEGFHACTYGAALYTAEIANAGNDYMDTTDANITNKFSTMATAWT